MGQTLEKLTAAAATSGYLQTLQLLPLTSTIARKFLGTVSLVNTFQVCRVGDLQADSSTVIKVADWLSGEVKGTRHREVEALCCKSPHCTGTGRFLML